MSRLPGVALVGCWLLSSIASSQSAPISDHPRMLQFPEVTIQLPTVDHRRFQLKSGPIVYLAEDHALPLVEISLALRVGAFLDPGDKAGLAYLTGSQMLRGGAGELDADDFDNRVDELGARLNTMSGATRSGASLSVPSWALSDALDLFFAMLVEPRFQKDRVASARGNLVESMSQRNTDPVEVLEREWQWLMYGEQHFSSRAMTTNSLEAITHEDLVRFHRQYWRPELMIVAISGDFDPTELLADLEVRFTRWPPADESAKSTSWPPPQPPSASPPALYHYEMNTPQAKVIIGLRLPVLLAWNAGERFALEVLAEVLGGQGAISRIAGRLRTAEGLVYRASAWLSPGELWPGEIQVSFDTRNQTVARAIELGVDEIQRLRNEPIHAQELAVVKQSLLARLRMNLDTAEEIAGYLAEDQLLGRPHSYRQDYLEAVDQMTASDLQAVARKYLQPEYFSFLVVGRWSDIAGGAAAGASELERVVAHTRNRLHPRDPLSLQAVPLD